MAENTPPPPKEPSEGGGKRPRRQKPRGEDKFEWNKATRTLLIWLLLIVFSWILFRQLNLSDKPKKNVSFTDYRRYIETDQIASAEIIDFEFQGKLKNDEGFIVTILPYIDQAMLAEWDSLGVDYQFKEKQTNWFGYLISSLLPWIIIIAVWLYFMRRMQGGGSRGVFSFGKSRAKLMMENKTRINFNDVAGCDEAKEELQEVIAFLRDPKKFSRLGGRIPKGALLLGPPGTGKTLLARAIAGEAEVPFFSMSGADFVEMFVGVGAARVRDLFEQGKKNAPCIIFIDEIDAVGRHRGAGLGGGHDEREQTLNQLLVEMDGFESNEGVILIAATNRPDVLDPALTRPGRFDRQIVVDRPDVRGREGILKVHTRNIPLSGNVRLDILAKGTPGLAGAELANLVNEAALLAARRNAKEVVMDDFEEAKDKVMMGTERKSMLISEEEKRQTAIHEAGHVLVAKLTPGSDPVHKVTIIPRGRALGLTHYLPLDEKHNYSRGYLTQSLTHLLGGRAAEKIVYNEYSTGAGNDIERATEIARKMVCEWGMSERVGPVNLSSKHEEVFLGRDFAQQRHFSERTAQDIDAEIRRIVTSAEQRAERILRDNISKLNLLADALLEREILDSEEINILLKGGKLPPAHPRAMEILQAVDKLEQGAKVETGAERKTSSGISGKEPSKPSAPTPPAPRKETPAATPSSQPRAASRREGDETETTHSRKRFARQYGIASSRDPRNRRPSMKQLTREKQIGPDSSKTESDKSVSTKPESSKPEPLRLEKSPLEPLKLEPLTPAPTEKEVPAPESKVSGTKPRRIYRHTRTRRKIVGAPKDSASSSGSNASPPAQDESKAQSKTKPWFEDEHAD